MPEPANVLAYNRYMYALGNPLKYSDPSGHCNVLSDGSRDLEGDAECWQWADQYYGSWYADPNYFSGGHDISPDDWMQNVATQSYADTDFIRNQVVAFWTPIYHEAGVRHEIFNPAPDWHAPPQHPLDITIQFCLANDCTSQVLNGIATTSALIAGGCSLAGPFGLPCVGASTAVGITASGVAVGRTAYQVTTDEATERDLAVAVGTFAIGSARKINPWIGVAASATQWIWDISKPKPRSAVSRY